MWTSTYRFFKYNLLSYLPERVEPLHCPGSHYKRPGNPLLLELPAAATRDQGIPYSCSYQQPQQETRESPTLVDTRSRNKRPGNPLLLLLTAAAARDLGIPYSCSCCSCQLLDAADVDTLREIRKQIVFKNRYVPVHINFICCTRSASYPIVWLRNWNSFFFFSLKLFKISFTKK